MVFSVPTFATVGDEYDKKKPIDQRTHGKSFVAVGPKSGNGPDALFEKEFHSIHEGDPYVDPGTADKRYRLEKAKKNLTSNGFRMASFPKKPTGAGDYHGTFNEGPLRHDTDYNVPRKGEKPPRKQPEKRGIFTAPTKKGTFGVTGTTLGGQIEHVACFYDSERQADRERAKKSRQLMKGAPFKNAGRLGATFDENPGTGASKCYTLTKPLSPRKEKPPSKTVVKGPDAPWRPSGQVPKKVAEIEYREDPYHGYDPRVAPKKRPVSDKAAFKPVGRTADSWYTKSIAFARL